MCWQKDRLLCRNAEATEVHDGYMAQAQPPKEARNEAESFEDMRCKYSVGLNADIRRPTMG